MNLTMMTGRMYNGAVYPYENKQTKEDRTLFRGRMNYRKQNGDYAWIDAVCFRDNPDTDANGLVGWLEDNYLAPEYEEDGHGGRAIEIVGKLSPTTKKKIVTLNLKGGGTKDIEVEYDTFEILIDEASFVPTNAGEDRRGSGKDDEEFDLDDDAEDDDGTFELEDEDDKPKSRNNGRSGKTSTGGRSSGTRTGGSGRSGSTPRNGSRQTSTGTRKSEKSNKGNRNTGSRTNSRKGTEDEPFFND